MCLGCLLDGAAAGVERPLRGAVGSRSEPALRPPCAPAGRQAGRQEIQPEERSRCVERSWAAGQTELGCCPSSRVFPEDSSSCHALGGSIPFAWPQEEPPDPPFHPLSLLRRGDHPFIYSATRIGTRLRLNPGPWTEGTFRGTPPGKARLVGRHCWGREQEKGVSRDRWHPERTGGGGG